MDNNFKYADKHEQLKRANQFLVMGYMVFYLISLAIMWSFCGMGIRSTGLAGAYTVIVVFAAVLTYAIGRKKVDSERYKYVMMPTNFIIGYLTGFAFSQGFMQLLILFPMIACVLYYDKKFTRTATAVYGILEVLIAVGKISTHQNLESDSVVNQIFVTVVYFVLLLLIILITDVTTKFNHDAIGQAQSDKEKMKLMLDDVMNVASEVRKGTENAMEIVNSLNSSTEIVNGAMKDISSSTLSTAENIQTQTTMTSNIQDAIENTLESSEKMVSFAKKSGELNDKSLEVMNQLKQQSDVISDTNSEVADAMNELKDRTDAVKSIADTIFSISSQTNL